MIHDHNPDSKSITYTGFNNDFAPYLPTGQRPLLGVMNFMNDKFLPGGETTSQVIPARFDFERCIKPFALRRFNHMPFIETMAPVGAPAAAAALHCLIDLGCTHIVSVGAAGVVQDRTTKYSFGIQGICDEGTSRHYIDHTVCTPDVYLAAQVAARFHNRTKERMESAIVWTTDAFFRETPQVLANRIDVHDAEIVDMEFAALCAICAFHKVSFSGYFYHGDAVPIGGVWTEPSFMQKRDERRLLRQHVVSTALQILDEQARKTSETPDPTGSGHQV